MVENEGDFGSGLDEFESERELPLENTEVEGEIPLRQCANVFSKKRTR